MADQWFGYLVVQRLLQGLAGIVHAVYPRKNSGNATGSLQRETARALTIRQATTAGQKTGKQKNIRHAEITGRRKPDAAGPADREVPA